MKITNVNTGTDNGDGFQVGIGSQGNVYINQKESADMYFETDDVIRVRIKDNGYVGINDPSVEYQLDVNGTISASAYHTSSDARWKNNVRSLDNSLDKILGLRGVLFNWNTEDFPEESFEEGDQIGFIAQEVENVIPEMVDTDSKGFKHLQYDNLIPILVEAVKDQQQVIEDLVLRVEELENK